MSIQTRFYFRSPAEEGPSPSKLKHAARLHWNWTLQLITKLLEIPLGDEEAHRMLSVFSDVRYVSEADMRPGDAMSALCHKQTSRRSISISFRITHPRLLSM